MKVEEPTFGSPLANPTPTPLREFNPQVNHQDRLRTLIDQEIDAAREKYHWLPPAEAVKEFRKEIAARIQRDRQREVEAAEKARIESERTAQQRWKQFNPRFEDIHEQFIQFAADREPPASGSAAAGGERTETRWMVGMFEMVKALAVRVAELEAVAARQ